jgi:hypothetical protein
VRLGLGFDEAPDFANDLGRGGSDAAHYSGAGCFQLDRFKFLLGRFGGNIRMGFAKGAFFSAPAIQIAFRFLRGDRRGGRFRRQAGGDIFRALNFLFVAGALEKRVRLFIACGFGAGLQGGAVGFLILAEAAAGTKAHSAAPPP